MQLRTPGHAELIEDTLDTLWRPFTQHAAGQKPTVLAEGRGSTVIDSEGNEYIDAMAGLWCVNVGYGEERLVDAATQQLRRLPYTSLVRPAPAALELARRLADKLPGDVNHVQFLNSGSEAVETALKIARQYARQRYPSQNRFKIIARYRGYHGWTGGALGATGQVGRKAPFEPLMAGAIHVRPPDTFWLFPDLAPAEASKRMIQEIEEVIEFEGAETIAAFIGEPIIGGGGIIIPPDEYWPAVRELCTRHGILLIQDEVITGFGRTGKWFGCQNWDVVPDIMVMAKGISSAYIPLAATAVTDAVFNNFLGEPSENRHFAQLSTYGGHPVACAVGVANLAVMEEKNLIDASAKMGERLLAGLREIAARHEIVGEARGRGLLCGLELINPNRREPASAVTVNGVIAEAMKRGVIVSKNVATVPRLESVLTFAPPLVITSDEIDRIVTVIDESLTAVAG